MKEITNSMIKACVDAKVADGIQFLQSASTYLEYGELEMSALPFIINRDCTSVEEWEKELKSKGVIHHLPSTTTSYFGKTVSTSVAYDKIAKSLFQYLHNFYDNYAQFLNRVLFANSQLPMKNVSFNRIGKNIKSLIPLHGKKIGNLVKSTMANTKNYGYLTALNNILKHYYSIDVDSSLDMASKRTNVEIKGFSYKGYTYPPCNFRNKAKTILSFTNDFLKECNSLVIGFLTAGIHPLVVNRYHNLTGKVTYINKKPAGCGQFMEINRCPEKEENFYILSVKIQHQIGLSIKNSCSDYIFLKDLKGKLIGILKACESLPGKQEIQLAKYRKYEVYHIGSIPDNLFKKIYEADKTILIR